MTKTAVVYDIKSRLLPLRLLASIVDETDFVYT